MNERCLAGVALSQHCLSPLLWCHNDRIGVSNARHLRLHECLFRRKSKKTSKLRIAGLCEGNSSVTGEYPAQRASKVENVSIWWRHHVKQYSLEILHYWKECRELHDPYIYLRIHLIGHVTLAGNIGTIYRVPYRSVMSYQLSHSRINARAMTLTPGHQNVDRAVTSL